MFNNNIIITLISEKPWQTYINQTKIGSYKVVGNLTHEYFGINGSEFVSKLLSEVCQFATM